MAVMVEMVVVLVVVVMIVALIGAMGHGSKPIQIRTGNSICIDQIIPIQIVRKIFISMGNCL